MMKLDNSDENDHFGGPRPPQAAEKIGIFLVLGGNLASVPPLLFTLLKQGGVHSLEIPLIDSVAISA